MYIALLNMELVNHILNRTPTECGMGIDTIFVQDRQDVVDLVVAKINDGGNRHITKGNIMINPLAEGIWIVKLRILFKTTTIGSLRKATNALRITDISDNTESGILFQYRILFILPEDVSSYLLMYAESMTSVAKCMDDVKDNEFGITVFYEENPFYDANQNMKTFSELYSE